MLPQKKKSGLGRGLGVILAENSTSEAQNNPVVAATSINDIPLNSIERNPFQPRNEFEQTALEELAASIRVHGIIQPLTVRRLSDNAFQLISGERRLRASELVGLETVPAYIRTANDEQMIEMALIENIQREDLNPMEIAFSYKRMIEELHLRQEDLSEKVGKKRETISNYLRLLKLAPDIQDALVARKLSMGHAKTLITIERTEQQLALFRQIIEKGLSVRQAEELRKLFDAKQTAPKPVPAAPKKEDIYAGIHAQQVRNKLENKFGAKIAFKQQQDGKGEIAIPFVNTDDLNRILEILDLV